jgi:hypothetical protein
VANNFEAKIDLKTVEFLLDLPTEFSINDVKLENDSIILSISTDLDVPSNVTFQYQTDEYGNIALVGMG